MRCPSFVAARVPRLAGVGAVLGLLLAASPAQAARVHAAPEPLRCAGSGLCMSPTEDQSLVGAFRLGDQELQFEALYRPYIDTTGTWNYPPWCVRLTAPDGEVYATLYGSPDCLATWYPNWRESVTVEDVAEQTRRTVTDGPIVFTALDAAAVSLPPAGREAAWHQVRALMDNFADTVRFHTR